MTDRPQSMEAASGILEDSRHNLSCAIFEKRFSRRASSLNFYIDLFRKFSFNFIKSRIREWIQIKLNRISKGDNFSDKLKKENTEYFEVENINSKNVENVLKRLKPDVIVLAGAPIVKSNILQCARECTINVHRSLLPKYAGLDAIFWALYHDEEKIGATVHTVNEKIDAGKIILQVEKKVLPKDDVDSLTRWYNKKVPDLLVQSLDLLCDPEFTPKEQDLSERSYYSWPTKKQRKELERKLERKKLNHK